MAELTFDSFSLAKVASLLGATEPALRLLLSILFGYPLAFIHRYTLYAKEPLYQHIYFFVSGLLIGYFNYGFDILHSLTTVVTVYIILACIGGTAASVLAVFSFTMVYLLTGYYYTGTETYDIKWSMPQCVLTLRLIGLSFDLYDGKKKPDELSTEQRKIGLHHLPSFLEVAGHTYFPSSFLVGPQFPLQRYLDFVAGRFTERGSLPDCVPYGLKRFGLGCLYLGLYQFGTLFFPDSYLLSEEFEVLWLWRKCLVLALWGKITLYKYISCWLMSEGGCIVAGLTYNGKTPKSEGGESTWDGCANVLLGVFEGASKFGHYITSFNINTNHWVSHYVYKRLKFLGNRFISQAVALIFLAIWHGLHSGYYMCFFMEFIVMMLEKDLETALSKNRKVMSIVQKPTVVPVVYIVLKLYTLIFMGYSLLPFALLSFSKWWKVYSSVYFIGHLIFGLWPLYGRIVKHYLSTIDKSD